MVRILLIEDHDEFRRIVRRVLERAGHDVIELPNGLGALELCESRRPDVVVTDILMPERDGLETIIGIRRQHPDVKVVAMSGGGDLGINYLNTAEDLGAVRALQKPFEMTELLAAIGSTRRE